MAKLSKTLNFGNPETIQSMSDIRVFLRRMADELNRNHRVVYDTFMRVIIERQVTYSTNMNTDVAGKTKEIVFCSTDSKFYGCTSGGVAGSATWAALN